MFKKLDQPPQTSLIAPNAFDDPALAEVLAHQTRAKIIGRIVGSNLSFEDCLKLGLAVKQCLALAKKLDDPTVDERICKFQLAHFPRVSQGQMLELLRPIKIELRAELHVTLRDIGEQRDRAKWIKRIVGTSLTAEECAKLGMTVKLQLLLPDSSNTATVDRCIVAVALKAYPALRSHQVEEIARVARHEHQPDFRELDRRLKTLPVAATPEQA